MDGVVIAGFTIGRAVLYFALCWSVYVSARALYEAFRTYKCGFELAGTELESWQHKRSHIAALLGVAFYNFYNIFAYVWFDLEAAQQLGEDDRTIGIFNVFFFNLLWLFLINHFKQERVGEISRSGWWDILKF